MYINQDTKLYVSFAKIATSFDCKLFNISFRFYNINAIYKSFGIHNIKNGIEAARILGIKGFAINMPFKTEALKYIEELSSEVKEIGAANTVIRRNNKFKAYNTEFRAAMVYLHRFVNKPLIILGNGGYASAVKYAANMLDMKFTQITRENWDDISSINDHIIYNCTPVENIIVNDTNIYIDSAVKTKTGTLLSMMEASQQFKLYTGFNFPLNIG